MTSKAAFNLVGYRYNKVSIDIDKVSDKDDVKVHFHTEGILDESDGSFELKLQTTIGDSENEFVKVTLTAQFQFSGPLTLNEVPNYFYTNAIAILFPYMRAYISMVTNQAGLNPIILPLYNLSDLAGPFKESTRAK